MSRGWAVNSSRIVISRPGFPRPFFVVLTPLFLLFVGFGSGLGVTFLSRKGVYVG